VTLPDLPALGSRDRIEAWEGIVVADAISWFEEPGDVSAGYLRESVGGLLEAQEAHRALKAETAPPSRS
jgi:hypothetical protein